MSKIDNLENFIAQANITHNNKYSYENAIYDGRRTKLKINCPLHGEFLQCPYNHLNGNECIKCGRIKKANMERIKQAELFIKQATQIHNGIYTYENINYHNNYTKVIINCNLHGPFNQSPASHTHKTHPTGCPECYGSKKLTNEEFIALCNIKHNNKYIYDKTIFDGTKKDIIIGCPEHGYFSLRADGHKTGVGCKLCYYESLKLTHEEFINACKLKHNNKYIYDKTVYNDSHQKIIIGCSTHGYFSQTANHHKEGYGCQKCNMCPSCALWRTMGKLCEYCKPKNQNKLYQKTKEMEVVRFLKDKLPDNEFIHNKSVGSDCSGGHLFPDILFDCNWYSLIVEVDEKQHRGANYSCDKKRMFDIIAKLGMPCIFIRYNPDNKNSDKQILLNKVTEYLNLTDKIWDDFGFLVTYLFYK